MPLQELFRRLRYADRCNASAEELHEQQELLARVAPRWYCTVAPSGRLPTDDDGPIARIDNRVSFSDVLRELRAAR